MRKPANGSQLQESLMIVMTTGLTGLIALMRQDEKTAARTEERAPVRPTVVSDGQKLRARPG
ncbi:hypothetical protein BBAL3_2197 [Brevundimonas sp. BAL3]|nr:hypothetical protein BBAL3_2197 [Brevundimonas sp. BAL3]